MTAKLAYEIIMTLEEKERELLFDMLMPHTVEFDIDDLVSKENQFDFNKQEMTEYLIKRLFSNVKKSNS
jgi:hypothetical protein